MPQPHRKEPAVKGAISPQQAVL